MSGEELVARVVAAINEIEAVDEAVHAAWRATDDIGDDARLLSKLADLRRQAHATAALIEARAARLRADAIRRADRAVAS